MLLLRLQLLGLNILLAGTDLLWENATGSEIYLPYMTSIHERSSTSELVAEIIKGAVHTFIIYLFLCIKEFLLQNKKTIKLINLNTEYFYNR
jgi:hypothetical protein